MVSSKAAQSPQASQSLAWVCLLCYALTLFWSMERDMTYPLPDHALFGARRGQSLVTGTVTFIYLGCI